VTDQQIERVSLAEIDPPAHAARVNIADDKLAELEKSIRQLGVIEPLILCRHANRYEVVAGHRRMLAAQGAGLVSIPAIVYAEGDLRLDAIKLHENIMREELNAGEEAIFFRELLEKHQWLEVEMCEILRVSPEYLATRLRLTRGDPAVLESLCKAEIGYGAAAELNQMKRAEDRKYYLEYCKANGASIRTVRDWRIRANLAAENPPADTGVTATAEAGGDGRGGPSPPVSSFLGMAQSYELGRGQEQVECRFCSYRDQDWRMFKVRVCQPCAQKIFVEQGGRP
jgi:ParB family chromosome partitioning protein